MIRVINCHQIMDKMQKFLDSAFGTPAGDTLTLLEVGPSESYDTAHILRAIHMTEEQVALKARNRIPNPASEVVVYGDRENLQSVQNAAQMLNSLGYSNVYIYSAGKEDWLSNGFWSESFIVPAAEPYRKQKPAPNVSHPKISRAA